MADGQKAVIGHYSQKHVIHTYKYHKKRHLYQAANIGNEPAVSYGVHNHLWYCSGDETDVNNRQVGEEEAHGGVEVGVRDDSQDDEQVPKHCDKARRADPKTLLCLLLNEAYVSVLNIEINAKSGRSFLMQTTTETEAQAWDSLD
ncbi:hypothetical protein H920_08638 [Fukomys damarensis]|uniref:Uncharacterized protein n=1 Tax=Fukomys damarensis TaxID=885580 RepID=A0A091DFX2_FUKDA|nr:hypothetical protein H920_08638 [Fukomys damarensis]